MRQHFVLKEACPRENLEEESNLLVFYQSLLYLEEKKYPTLASNIIQSHVREGEEWRSTCEVHSPEAQAQ